MHTVIRERGGEKGGEDTLMAPVDGCLVMRDILPQTTAVDPHQDAPNCICQETLVSLAHNWQFQVRWYTDRISPISRSRGAVVLG